MATKEEIESAYAAYEAQAREVLPVYGPKGPAQFITPLGCRPVKCPPPPKPLVTVKAQRAIANAEAVYNSYQLVRAIFSAQSRNSRNIKRNRNKQSLNKRKP